MDQGKIVFQGTPDELTARGEGPRRGRRPAGARLQRGPRGGPVMTATTRPAARPRPVTRGSAAGFGPAAAAGAAPQRDAVAAAAGRRAVLVHHLPHGHGAAAAVDAARHEPADRRPARSSCRPSPGRPPGWARGRAAAALADLVAITARPRWARQLAAWAATTCWALAGYLACVAVLYGVTARQGAWGGPLWWPAAVGAASLPAFSALGFAAGALLPSRFTAPLAAVAAFLALALSDRVDPRQPLVLADLAAGRRPLGHRARPGRRRRSTATCPTCRSPR